MIEIRDGFTSIDVGVDSLHGHWRDPLTAARTPTGARVTLSFKRQNALPVGEMVSVRYDIAGDGGVREARGTPRPSHTVKNGGDTAYHYRLSVWVSPHTVMHFLPRGVRHRTVADEAQVVAAVSSPCACRAKPAARP